MAIYAKDPGSSFVVPAEGLHPAVACDVADLGVLDVGFGEKPMIKLTWQVDEAHPETGRPLTVTRRTSATGGTTASAECRCGSYRSTRPFATANQNTQTGST